MYCTRFVKQTCFPAMIAAMALIASVVGASQALAAKSKVLVLTGEDLTIEDVVGVARRGQKVKASEKAMARAEKAHRLLLAYAAKGNNVYGLNVGVGLNKDKTIIKSGVLDEKSRKASEAFNHMMLLSHSVAVGPECADDVVRAMMLARVNGMLTGHVACQTAVIKQHIDFLNAGIIPVVPSRGTVGEADITILPHIALVMMGEHKAYYQGKLMSGADALKAAGLKPIRPYGKDSLSMLSSNAYAAGLGALVVSDAEDFLNKADLVYGLSLEGFNGNVGPMFKINQELRPYPGQNRTAANVRRALKGSYLWELYKGRRLQDPLSFRDYSQTIGAARDIIETIKKNLVLHMNHTDDNPTVALYAKPAKDAPGQLSRCYVYESEDINGMVLPSSHFEAINWTMNFEELAIALSHVSRSSCYRTIKLGTPRFTKLSRFLAPDKVTLAFTTIQKAFASLDTEIRMLSNPASRDFMALAGHIEDMGTNSGLVINRVAKIIDNLYYIYGIELMHAAQATDLRQRDSKNITLGQSTSALRAAYRKQVPFLNKDRLLSYDVENSHSFLKGYQPAN